MMGRKPKTVGQLKKEIEKAKKLPEGSVSIVKKNGEKYRKNKQVRNLEK